MKNATMKCNDVHELIPDLASGMSEVTPKVNEHMQECPECATMFTEFRHTMALLDEWEAPEPSPYFDTRMRARLREEVAKQQPVAWFGWLRKPTMAFSLVAILVMGITLFRGDGNRFKLSEPIATTPGTAVGDLQALDKNHELYSDFDVLDDLEVQPDVTANP